MCKMNVNDLHKTLRTLRLDNGLYLASIGQYYQKIWVRDSFYCALPELYANPDLYVQSMQSLLDYYQNIEHKYNKLTWLIKDPTDKTGYRYPHPRMTKDLDEIQEPWGFKQLDCLGEVLYGIWLGENKGYKIIRDDEDRRIITLLIEVLEKIQYWCDPDNGIWEENEEVHASSVGACVAGLTAIRTLGFKVNQQIIDAGLETLNNLLPRESATKKVDLALLTLIYPFNIVTSLQAKQIIANVEAELLRDRGVIRYKGDRYYNNSSNPVNHEAEWVFGLAYLSLAHNMLGQPDKAKYYITQIEKCYKDKTLPELFYSRTDKPNENNPLGWTLASAILAIRYNEIKNVELALA